VRNLITESCSSEQHFLLDDLLKKVAAIS